MPTPATNAERYEILVRLGLLDGARDPPLDRLAHIAARATASPIAIVSIVGPDRQWNRARFGTDNETTPLADSFCICAIDSPALLEVADASQDPRFATCASVNGPLGVRFYAGHPLMFDGVYLGTVCVLDVVPRVLSDSDRDVLADLSAVASDVLRSRDLQRLQRLGEQRALDCAGSAGQWLWETDVAHRIVWLSGPADGAFARACGDVTGQTLPDLPLLDWLGKARMPPVALHALMDAQQAFAAAVAAVTIGAVTAAAGADGPLDSVDGNPRIADASPVAAPAATESSTDANASTRLIARSGVPFVDSHGNHAGFRGICSDVTDRVRAEGRAFDADAAIRANRSKSEFLARVSHELRTPLNAILGFGQLLLFEDDDRRRLSPTQLGRLEAMHLAGRQLLALIDDMLDLARIEQGKTEMALKPLDLQALVSSTEMLLRPAALGSGVSVRNLCAAGTATVIGDERALGQVLLNLVSNAIKYNRAGGLVTVRSEEDDAVGEVLIVVEDNGNGMTEAQVAHLFQPFNRVGAERGAVPGTGLGLVISKSLVELMGGTLTVRSVVGVGSSAEVRLRSGLRPVEQTDG